jgi:hypothetical protein
VLLLGRGGQRGTAQAVARERREREREIQRASFAVDKLVDDACSLTGTFTCAGIMSSGGNRPISSSKQVELLDGATVDIKARVVTVKGKRGTLVRDFKHLNVEIYKSKDAKSGKDVIVVSCELRGKTLK